MERMGCEPGRVVISLQGRDEGRAFVVTGTIDEQHVWIADGVTRKLAHPKTKKIKHLACEVPEVMGAYDLLVTNFGPDRNYASMHIELPDTLTVEQADVITRKVQHEVYSHTGVILTGVGIYSHNTKDDVAAEIRNNVRKKRKRAAQQPSTK